METPSITCYPQPGKGKSRHLLEAFAAGAAGEVVHTSGLRPGPAAFYGVVGLEPLFHAARARGGWYYLDNAYFDAARGTHFRVGVNALQASGRGRPDWPRFAALGLGVQPWQKGGSRILVCPQSDWFLGVLGGVPHWTRDTVAALARHTDRPIHVRNWSRDKARQSAGFAADLRGAWAVVTHSSAAAIAALVAGVPVFCTAPCAALAMGSDDLAAIEQPRRPEGRLEWAAVLAGAQWTADELRDGTAWRTLHEEA